LERGGAAPPFCKAYPLYHRYKQHSVSASQKPVSAAAAARAFPLPTDVVKVTAKPLKIPGGVEISMVMRAAIAAPAFRNARVQLIVDDAAF
jgi:hypothetical protein